VIRVGAVSNPLMSILREREMRFALANAGSAVPVVASRFRGFDHAALARRLQPDLRALAAEPRNRLMEPCGRPGPRMGSHRVP
jgi:cyclohexanecarboxylate-CoA ligase